MANERGDVFEVVGGGDAPLTVEQKACLLRASRAELRRMQAELFRLKSLNTRYAGGPIAATESEIECLSAAVSWLWNHKGGGP